MAVTTYYRLGGELIGEETGGVQTDYLTDALGSVTATANQSAAVVNAYRYKPYGQLLQKTGAGADPSFQWVGSQGYRQTGKKYSDVYVRARHYDTNTERWTAKDPLWPEQPAYAYADQAPILISDPTGLLCLGPGDLCKDKQGQKEYCEWFMFQHPGETGKAGAFPLCCHGTLITCFSLTEWETKYIKRCLQQHEDCHGKDVFCPKKDTIEAPTWKNKGGQQDSECRCNRVGFDCCRNLNYGNDLIGAQLRDQCMCGQCRNMKKNCKGRNTPIYAPCLDKKLQQRCKELEGTF